MGTPAPKAGRIRYNAPRWSQCVKVHIAECHYNRFPSYLVFNTQAELLLFYFFFFFCYSGARVQTPTFFSHSCQHGQQTTSDWPASGDVNPHLTRLSACNSQCAGEASDERNGRTNLIINPFIIHHHKIINRIINFLEPRAYLIHFCNSFHLSPLFFF